MSLIAEIEEELAVAMRERDAPRRDTLRLILSNLRSAEKELQRELNDQEELQVLQRERKKRIEAAEAYRQAGNEERAEAEEEELDVIEEFMPEPLSEEEIESIIDDAIVLEPDLASGVRDELEHPLRLFRRKLADVAERLDVALGDDEQMRVGARVDVGDRDEAVSLTDVVALCVQLAEETVRRHRRSPPP